LSRLRAFTVLFAILAMSVAFAACGGSSDSTTGGGSSSEDPQTVLDQTFNNKSTIDSANIDVSFDVSEEGDNGGDFTASLTGPVDGTGDSFPKFDLTAKVNGSGGGQDINFEGGATSTGDAAYINYNGDDYQVDQQTFSYLSQAYAQGQTQQSSQGDLSAFKDVLTNVTNEGTEDVEGTESVHVSGDVDVSKLVTAIKPLAAQAQSLGSLSGGSVPTPQELDQVQQLVKSATFDVYSGQDDHLLRRLDATIDLDDPSSDQTATIEVDITLADVNQPQDISAPDNAKPLSDLLGGDLGSLLGSSGLGGTGGTTSGLSAGQSQCLQSATTSAQIQSCLSQ